MFVILKWFQWFVSIREQNVIVSTNNVSMCKLNVESNNKAGETAGPNLLENRKNCAQRIIHV